ncbi:MAG: protein kinase [Planctomycetota bacterium]
MQRLGPYQVLEVLGRGGVGIVLRARAPDGGEVAIKVLRDVSPERVERFGRELHLLAQLRVEGGFVPVLDTGVSEQGPYIVMPLLTGGTLEDRLRHGPLDPDDAQALARALAQALGRAHARGIVHRDLKPANVLFDAAGAPHIADLGLAKHFGTASALAEAALSRTGEARGTPGYMAPEQLEDAKNVGPAADVFALGAILYECLSGQGPFVDQTIAAMLARAAEGRYPPLRRARPQVTPALGAVVSRALSPDPNRRFPDGTALAQALLDASLRPDVGGESKLHGAALAVGLVLLGAALGALATRSGAPAPRLAGPGDPSPSASPTSTPASGPSDDPSPTSSDAPTPAPSEASSPTPTPSPASTAPVASPQQAWRPPEPAPPTPQGFPGACASVLRTRCHELVGVWGDYRGQHLGTVIGVVPSPDGRSLLSFGVGGDVRLWETETGEERQALLLQEPVLSGAFTPDGRGVAFGTKSGTVFLWPIGTFEAKGLKLEGGGVTGVVPVENGALLCVSEDGGLRCVELAKERVLGTVQSHPGGATRLIRQGGVIASAGRDGRVLVWDLEGASGVVRVVVPKPEREAAVLDVTLSPDAKRVCAVYGSGVLRCWRVEGTQPELLWAVPTDDAGGGVRTVCYVAAGRRLLLGGGEAVLQLDPLSGAHLPDAPPLPGHHPGVSALGALGAARALTGDMDGVLRRWDLASGKEGWRALEGHRGAVRSLLWEPRADLVVSGGLDGTVRSWDPARPRRQPVRTWSGFQGAVETLGCIPDGKTLYASAQDGTVRIEHLGASQGLRLELGEKIHSLQVFGGSLVMGRIDGKALVLALNAKTEGSQVHIQRLTIAQDGGRRLLRLLGPSLTEATYLVDLPDGRAALIPAQGGKTRVFGPKGGLTAAALSPDGTRLFTGGKGGHVDLWQLDQGDLHLADIDHSAPITAIAVASAERFAICAGRAVSVWQAPAKEEDSIDLNPLGDVPLQLAFSPDGRRLAVGTARGLVLLFQRTKD